ncbi:MAG: type II secretion system F family protein [Nocardioides sp.]
MTGLAVGCAALATLLWLRPRSSPGASPLSPLSIGEPSRSWWALGLLVPAATAAVLPGSTVALVVVAGLALVAVGRLWRRRTVRRQAERESARVLESCEQLAAELGAGQPPGLALQRVAADYPALGPVAEAFVLGADVPSALREAARRPGCGDLRLLAAGWQVAHRTGAGLGVTVEAIATSLRAAAATRRVVDGELASARATARLVALLPFLALAMGSGAGGEPWRFLLATPPGLVCLAGGLALGLAGLWWIEVLTGDPG